MSKYYCWCMAFIILLTSQKSYADGEYLGKNPELIVFTSLAIIGSPFLSGLSPNLYKKDETYSYWASTGLGIVGLIGGMTIGSAIGKSTSTKNIYDSQGNLIGTATESTSNFLPSLFLGGAGMLAGNYLGYLNTKKSVLKISSINVMPNSQGLTLAVNGIF